MGIMDFFRSKHVEKSAQGKENCKVEDVIQLPDISMFELETADWEKFAGILKRDGILANSYKKQPKEMHVSLDENNRPMITLTFESATSTSIREVELTQDSAIQYINGIISGGIKNQDLISTWKAFQEEIRYLNKLETNREGYFNKLHGDKLMKVAKKMQGMDNIYEREQEFLEKYKDANFDELTYGTMYIPPMFIPYTRDESGFIEYGEGVVPFTPRTLELCILRMTDECKAESGLFLREFEQRCKRIAEESCFKSDNWDRVISYGKDIIRSKYLETEWGREIER